MNVATDLLARISPDAPAFNAGLSEACDRYEITTALRLSHFLAQCAHESGGFRLMVENLNYGAPALLAVFGKYFPTRAAAERCQRQPEKIANKVYSGRMGNGDEASGDGWRYRGRGLIQVTGHDNYAACSLSLFNDRMWLLDNADELAKPRGAALSAGWFWDSRRLNEKADADDLVGITRAVNGGTHGLEDRAEWLRKIKIEVMGAPR